jgi:hypothetical protein
VGDGGLGKNWSHLFLYVLVGTIVLAGATLSARLSSAQAVAADVVGAWLVNETAPLTPSTDTVWLIQRSSEGDGFDVSIPHRTLNFVGATATADPLTLSGRSGESGVVEVTFAGADQFTGRLVDPGGFFRMTVVGRRASFDVRRRLDLVGLSTLAAANNALTEELAQKDRLLRDLQGTATQTATAISDLQEEASRLKSDLIAASAERETLEEQYAAAADQAARELEMTIGLVANLEDDLRVASQRIDEINTALALAEAQLVTLTEERRVLAEEIDQNRIEFFALEEANGQLRGELDEIKLRPPEIDPVGLRAEYVALPGASLLRAPAPDAAAVRQLSENEPVILMANLTGMTWSLVITTAGQVGFVSARLIRRIDGVPVQIFDDGGGERIALTFPSLRPGETELLLSAPGFVSIRGQVFARSRVVSLDVGGVSVSLGNSNTFESSLLVPDDGRSVRIVATREDGTTIVLDFNVLVRAASP